ncbi:MULTISPECIES: hypothetical protein [unclassified Streptomyces]|uniref:hypothetical protein n=1 Tax=unclassified Streptomyces TaxID=2593676 RepID=UPI00371CFDEC
MSITLRHAAPVRSPFAVNAVSAYGLSRFWQGFRSRRSCRSYVHVQASTRISARSGKWPVGPVPSSLEQLCDLRVGQGANCGHSITIRESDLQEQVEDGLSAWAGKLDASWPDVPEKRKAERLSAPGLTQPRSRRNAPARRNTGNLGAIRSLLLAWQERVS